MWYNGVGNEIRCRIRDGVTGDEYRLEISPAETLNDDNWHIAIWHANSRQHVNIDGRWYDTNDPEANVVIVGTFDETDWAASINWAGNPLRVGVGASAATVSTFHLDGEVALPMISGRATWGAEEPRPFDDLLNRLGFPVTRASYFQGLIGRSLLQP